MYVSNLINFTHLMSFYYDKIFVYTYDQESIIKTLDMMYCTVLASYLVVFVNVYV